MRFHNERNKVLIIDFGSQVTKLIGRNVRELGVYSEIITPSELKSVTNFNTIKGIIFSGGPSSVTLRKFQTIPKKIFQKNIPILGILLRFTINCKIIRGKIKPQK